ncbi:MAG: extracellular solute-binding protein [Clostridia bacterium]|nr:extracellular solute-binding protein [Clostridia bacterium]
MKKLLKTLAILLSIAMLFSVVGCGKTESKPTNVEDDDDYFTETIESIEVLGDSSTGTNSNSNTGSSGNGSGSNTGSGEKKWKDILASMPSDLSNTTIEIFNWNPANEYTGAPKVIQEFTKQTGIKVKWTTENFDNYLNKLASRVAAGNSPDLVRLRNPMPTSLTSIQPIDAMKFDFSDGAWDKWVMDSYTFNGKTFGVSLSGTHISSPIMLSYNKSLIRKYDLSDPYQLWKSNKWTYDAMINLCQEYKKEAGSDYAITGSSAEIALVGIAGTVKYDGKKFVSAMNDADMLTGLQNYCDLSNNKKIYAPTYDTEGFDANKVLMFICSGIHIRRMNSYFQNLKSSNSLGVVPLPPVSGTKNTTMFGELEAYGLAKGAKNPKAAPYFLRFFLDSANYDTTAFFANAQAKEVYESLMSSNNKVWSAGEADHEKFTKITDPGIGKAIQNATSEQAKSVIDQIKPLVDNRVKNLNDILAKLK